MKELNLGKAIGIVANIGVIAGIVFLAYELRQNNQFLAEEARYSVLQNQLGFTELLGTNEDAARLVLSSNSGQPLSELERLQRHELLKALLRRWEWEYQRFLLGITDIPPPEAYRSRSNGVDLATDWDALKSQYTPEFIQFMEENVIDR